MTWDYMGNMELHGIAAFCDLITYDHIHGITWNSIFCNLVVWGCHHACEADHTVSVAGAVFPSRCLVCTVITAQTSGLAVLPTPFILSQVVMVYCSAVKLLIMQTGVWLRLSKHTNPLVLLPFHSVQNGVFIAVMFKIIQTLICTMSMKDRISLYGLQDLFKVWVQLHSRLATKCFGEAKAFTFHMFIPYSSF